jgi:AraC family transcriptional regulator, transcriptional activator of pobA
MIAIQITSGQLAPTRRQVTNECLSILFIGKGNGRCLRHGEPLILQENTVYTGFANCFQQFELEEAAIGYLVSVNPRKLATSFESVTVVYEELFAGNRPGIRLDPESAGEIHWLVTRIIKGMHSKDKYTLEFVQKYVSLLLLCLKAQLRDELVLVSMSRKGILLKGFFSLLEEAYMTAKTVDYYAGKLCVTAKHLTTVIKLESGYPTSYHINQRIIQEAKRIANTTGSGLKQIAYQLGYEDVSAFSKLFKRVTGETFSSYRCNLKFGYANWRNRNII